MTFPVARPVRLPGLLAQARNATRAVVRNVASVARGNPLLVETMEQSRRYAVCSGCSLFIVDSERCGHNKCGCFARAKTWLQAEKCPDDKW